MSYAERTEVSVQKSLNQIATMAKKAGAQRIAQAEIEDGFAVQFFLHDRMLRFRVPVPAPTVRGAEQKVRQRARALHLVIKAKLESVETGVETFEEAFLANVVMPDGKTVAELSLPLIAQAYSDGRTPPLMLPMY